MKSLEWHGTSLNDLKRFPVTARQDAGYQLDKIQRGEEPDDWKYLGVIGVGVKEIRIRDIAGAFRVIYVAGVGDTIHVLHAFQKKSQKTPERDLVIAKTRFRALVARAKL